MRPELISQLTDVGLSDKEARVYVGMLTLGPSGVQEIADASGVNRATTYLMLESLVHRGLASTFEQEKKAMFVAETPKKLADLIENQSKTLEEKREKLVFFVPELEALHRTVRSKPVVRFYEGEDGLRSMRDHLSRITSKRYDTFARLTKTLHDIAATDEERRFNTSKGKQVFRIIYVADPGVDLPNFSDELRSKTEIRFADNIPFDFEGEIGILDETAYLATTEPKVTACVIESKALASLMRAQFELAWQSASASCP
jgi:HTH-type transcriptional regulator, sugar sensing transcriptional regulator